jgi:hypothetical protein
MIRLRNYTLINFGYNDDLLFLVRKVSDKHFNNLYNNNIMFLNFKSNLSLKELNNYFSIDDVNYVIMENNENVIYNLNNKFNVIKNDDSNSINKNNINLLFSLTKI